VSLRNVTLLRCDPESSNVYSSFSHPGLGLPIIGTVLSRAGYQVRIFVDSILPPSREDLAHGELVGFTVNSACSRESFALADRLRKEVGCPIVFGGPHVTSLPGEGLEHGDFVVRKEGERTVLELARALDRGATDFGGILGLSWRDAGGRFHHNPDRPVEESFDLVPDQSLIAGYRELNQRWTQHLFPTGMLVSTSRGCPFRCTFCTIPQVYGNAMRFRSHDAVVADIRQQIAFSGRRYIYFADDNFTALRQQAKALLQRLVDERLDIRFSAQVRADVTQDPELMDLLVAAGCYLVFVGFESINDATLKAYRKGNQTRAGIERAIRELHARGVLVHGMFVLGADEDGPGAALQTARWALEQRLESIQILPLCPLPGTETLSALEAQGRLYKEWDPAAGREQLNYGAGNYVLHRPARMEAAQLQREILDAHRLFYSRRSLWRSALRIPLDGLSPFLFRALGRQILRHAEPEIQRHLSWLESASLAPPRSAAAIRQEVA